MNLRTHAELANFIWDICNLLRGPYKRNEYHKVILPLTVLRRFDCVQEKTKQAVLDADAGYAGGTRACTEASSSRRRAGRSRTRPGSTSNACSTTRTTWHRTSAPTSAISHPNVSEIMERSAFSEQIAFAASPARYSRRLRKSIKPGISDRA